MKSIVLALSLCMACSSAHPDDRTEDASPADGGSNDRNDAVPSQFSDAAPPRLSDAAPGPGPPLAERGIDVDLRRAFDAICVAQRDAQCAASTACGCESSEHPACDAPLDACRDLELSDARSVLRFEPDAVDLAQLHRCVEAYALHGRSCGRFPIEECATVFYAAEVALGEACPHSGVCADGAGFCDCSAEEDLEERCEARCVALPVLGERCHLTRRVGVNRCAAGLRCDGQDVCSPTPALGCEDCSADGACDRDGECGTGELCESGRCVAVARDTACRSDVDCGAESRCLGAEFRCGQGRAIGERCLFLGCVKGARCVDEFCVALGGEGAECYANEDCEEGIACMNDPSGEVTGRCRRPASRGGACDPYRGTPEHPGCEAGLVCGVDGTCGDAPAQGEPCFVDRVPCADGLGCEYVEQATGEGAELCVPFVAGGGHCFAQSACVPGLTCRDGLCADLGGSGASCWESNDCRAGLLCIDAICQPPLGHDAPCQPADDRPSPCASRDEVCVQIAPNGASCEPRICTTPFPHEPWY